MLPSFAGQKLTFKEEAQLKAGKVKLSDLAKIEGFSAEAEKLVSDIVLIEDIKSGELRKLSAQAVTDVLRRKIPKIRKLEQVNNGEFNLKLIIPNLISAYVNQKSWSDKGLQAFIKKENQKFCPECSFQFEHFSLPKLKYEKVSRWTLEKPKELIKGSFRLALKVQRHQEQRPQTYYVTGRMSAFKELPVARRNLNRGARIMKDDVIFEKRPWNFTRKDIPTNKELFGGKLKRMALSGGVIWLSNIEKEKAIERGQLVELIVKKSDWEIRMKGVAQESGMVGDTVSVLNRKSKKVVMGKVIGTKEVAVQ